MQIVAEKRTKYGKDTKKLRRENNIPAVMFGKGVDSLALTIALNDFVRVYREAGETNLVDLKIDGSISKVLIRDVQLHPVSSEILHINLQKVNLKEKLTADIPVEIINEEENEHVKSGEGIVLLLLNTISVEALPTDLPDVFTIDAASIANIGDVVTVADLTYDKTKVEIVHHEAEDLVAKLDYAGTLEEEEEITEEEMLEKLEVTSEVEPKDDEEAEGEEE